MKESNWQRYPNRCMTFVEHWPILLISMVPKNVWRIHLHCMYNCTKKTSLKSLIGPKCTSPSQRGHGEATKYYFKFPLVGSVWYLCTKVSCWPLFIFLQMRKPWLEETSNQGFLKPQFAWAMNLFEETLVCPLLVTSFVVIAFQTLHILLLFKIPPFFSLPFLVRARTSLTNNPIWSRRRRRSDLTSILITHTHTHKKP